MKTINGMRYRMFMNTVLVLFKDRNLSSIFHAYTEFHRGVTEFHGVKT